MELKTLLLRLLLSVLLTVCAILLYDALPAKTADLKTLAAHNTQLFEAYAKEQTASNVWISNDDIHFSCAVENTKPGHQCGLNLFLGESGGFQNGVNLERFDEVVIKGSYIGPNKKVKIFFRNYNPAFSNPTDANSAKFISLTLSTDEFNKPGGIHIPIAELTVATWWLDQQTLSRQFLPAKFDNITVAGLDFGDKLSLNDKLEFQLISFEFRGPIVSRDFWYLGILIFWIASILILAFSQLLQLNRRQSIYSNTISAMVNDQASLIQQREVAVQSAMQDSLTDTLNRLGIDEATDNIRKNTSIESASIVIIDLDHFKRINDTRGHDVGDNVLKMVASCVKDNIRSNDIFGRWGGEEFLLIFPNVPLKQAIWIAEKIRKSIFSNEAIKSLKLSVSASFGVHQWNSKEESFPDAFHQVDQALYKAKSNGRNCVEVSSRACDGSETA